MGRQVTTRPATTTQWAMVKAAFVILVVGGVFSLLVANGTLAQRVYPPEQAFSVKDCMPACVIEGVQYMPLWSLRECWCDMRKRTQALTTNQ